MKKEIIRLPQKNIVPPGSNFNVQTKRDLYLLINNPLWQSNQYSAVPQNTIVSSSACKPCLEGPKPHRVTWPVAFRKSFGPETSVNEMPVSP